MNINDTPLDVLPHSLEAEQAVLGSLLLDNDALDRVAHLQAEHFYDYDHGRIFAEIARQIAAGKRCDVVTVFEKLQAEIADVLPYLNTLAHSTPSSANIERYAGIVMDKALKRALISLGGELADKARGATASIDLIDATASKLEQFAQKRMKKEPQLLRDMLCDYADLLESRMNGDIKPIQTGFRDLDEKLVGGMERQTLTVVAARPAMGKSAFALATCRNVAQWGSALFLSMEMSKNQVSDRNVAALGNISLKWLRKPTPEHSDNWNRLTAAFARANELKFHIDDETSLNMLAIRAKARHVKRRFGLDLLAIDQLSFITGSKAEIKSEEFGEYTRGLLALAKELDCAVLLLCQLNRDCEKRSDKRPQMSDLNWSGSIEQDAENIVFLYRDEVYNPDTMNKGVCEAIIAKARQGETGMCGLHYSGEQTRFDDLAPGWRRAEDQPTPRRRGFE